MITATTKDISMIGKLMIWKTTFAKQLQLDFKIISFVYITVPQN